MKRIIFALSIILFCSTATMQSQMYFEFDAGATNFNDYTTTSITKACDPNCPPPNCCPPDTLISPPTNSFYTVTGADGETYLRLYNFCIMKFPVFGAQGCIQRAGAFCFVSILGIGTNRLKIEWWIFSNSLAQDDLTCPYTTFAIADLVGNLALNIENSVVGDTIAINYLWDFYSSAQNISESNAEDIARVISTQLSLNGQQQFIPGTMNASFQDALGDYKSCFNGNSNNSGSFNLIGGNPLNIGLSSMAHTKIDIPPDTNSNDKAIAQAWGTLFLAIEEPVNKPDSEDDILYSLDIGSDAELSDPFNPANNYYDPGDMYLRNGVYPPPPANGHINDTQYFGYDPAPDPLNSTIAPVCDQSVAFDSIQYRYFNIDGFDKTDINLIDYNFGPQYPSVPHTSSNCVHYPYYLIYSFSENNGGFYTGQYCDVATNITAPKGTAYENDEIMTGIVYPLPNSNKFIVSEAPLFSEDSLHQLLTPNPDIDPTANDDVNALTVGSSDLTECDNLYFTVSYQTKYVFRPNLIDYDTLNPGSIYLKTSSMIGFTEIINPEIHLGLQDGVDIDAFEFCWLYDSLEQRLGLALLFSVAQDNWSTNEDESGGLNPNMLYYSFLNGTFEEFQDIEFSDNIDALAVTPYLLFPNYSTYQPVPQPPQLISPPNFEIFYVTDIDFIWSSSLNASEYQLQIATDESFDPSTIIEDNIIVDTTYLSLGLPTNTSFYWKVRAINTNGVSPWTNYNKFEIMSVSQQNIYLMAGWNLISSYINPLLPNFVDIFTPIVQNINIARNNIGQMYVPAFGINTIGNWNPSEGYFVNTFSNETLQMFGTEINPESYPINCSQGWNLISYLRSSAMPAEIALATINDEIILLRSNSGRMYCPLYNINTIGNLQPGQGYKLYVNQDCILTYPANTLRSAASTQSEILNPVYFKINEKISLNYSNLIISNDNIANGAEIAVFNSQDELIGSVVYENGKCAVAVPGADEFSNTTCAYENETLYLQIYNNGFVSDVTVKNVINIINNKKYDNIIYFNDDILFIEIDIPEYYVLENSVNVFPNPSSNLVVLDFQLPESSSVTVKIYNSRGELIDNQNYNYLENGRNQIQLNCKNYLNDIYYVKIINEKYSLSGSFIIIK